MPLASGDVLYVWCDRITPPHDKYCICVSPEDRWFLFINTKPPRARDAAVLIRSYELDCLDHNSYVDTSFVYMLSEDEIASALARRNRHKGPLSNMLKLRIKTNVRNHNLLRKQLRDAIMHRL